MWGYKKRQIEEHTAEIAAMRNRHETALAKLEQGTLQHYVECAERHEDQAAINNDVKQTKAEVMEMRKTQAWIGDCVVGIATKMDVKIPQRP